MTIDRSELDEQANTLLEEIAKHSGSFELEEVAEFANGIKVTKIKAPSEDTTDISMQIQDIHTNYVRDVGFSIKSSIHSANFSISYCSIKYPFSLFGENDFFMLTALTVQNYL